MNSFITPTKLINFKKDIFEGALQALEKKTQSKWNFDQNHLKLSCDWFVVKNYPHIGWLAMHFNGYSPIVTNQAYLTTDMLYDLSKQAEADLKQKGVLFKCESDWISIDSLKKKGYEQYIIRVFFQAKSHCDKPRDSLLLTSAVYTNIDEISAMAKGIFSYPELTVEDYQICISELKKNIPNSKDYQLTTFNSRPAITATIPISALEDDKYLNINHINFNYTEFFLGTEYTKIYMFNPLEVKQIFEIEGKLTSEETRTQNKVKFEQEKIQNNLNQIENHSLIAQNGFFSIKIQNRNFKISEAYFHARINQNPSILS